MIGLVNFVFEAQLYTGVTHYVGSVDIKSKVVFVLRNATFVFMSTELMEQSDV